MIARLILLLGSITLASAQTYTIAGSVFDADSGAPLENARVEIQPRNQQGGDTAPLAVLSSKDGKFSIFNTPGGNYFLYAAKSGYLPPELPGKSSGQALDLTGKATEVAAKFWLRRQSAVEGRITAETGLAVQGVGVNLWRVVIADGRKTFELANGASTDSNGVFRIPALQAGRYILGANLSVSQINAPGSRTLGALFFPSATAPQSAKLLTLSPGATESIDMKLPSVPAFQVRGKVAANGRYPSVILRSSRLAGISREYSGLWDQATQSFALEGIPAGAYDLEATMQADGVVLIAAQPLLVADRNVEGLTLNPIPLRSIQGTILYLGRPNPPVGLVQLQSDRSTIHAPVQAEGKFQFLNVRPGRYRLTLPGQGAQRLKQAQQDGRDALEDGVLHSGGAVTVTVSDKTGVLAGMLPSTAPHTVALFSTRGNELKLEAMQFFAGSRQFAVQSILPGTYLAVAWAGNRSASELEYTAPEIAAGLLRVSRTVTIAEGETTTTDLDQLFPFKLN